MSNSHSIAEIKQILAQITDPAEPLLEELRLDSRKGVQNELKRWQARYEKVQNSIKHHATMLNYENQLKAEGFQSGHM